VDRKPGSVITEVTTAIHLGRQLLAVSSSLPGNQGERATPRWRTIFFPAWLCFQWGLPSHISHLTCWWALTSPFHPYPLSGRSTFCCTIPDLTAGRCYRPLCSTKPGLSSRSTCEPAAIQSTCNPQSLFWNNPVKC